jgi:hypothetical protein
MGLFLLAEVTHAAFDKVLARFFWEGVWEKRNIIGFGGKIAVFHRSWVA